MTLAEDPVGSKYTPISDETRIQHLSPKLQDIARTHLELVRERIENHPQAFRARIGETFRSPERQWHLYGKGRVYVPESRRWKVVRRKSIVTNARPDKTAHCVTDKNGDPDARAYHITLLQPDSDHFIPDKDPRWAIAVSALSSLIAPDALIQITAGAFFRSIPGGDWAHFEQADWRQELGR